MTGFTVADAQAGTRLDRLVAERAEVGSRGAAERLIDAGLVTVDGDARPKSFRVQPGMRVDVGALAEEPAPEGDLPEPRIVHADDAVIVVDKPIGVVVHPAPGTRSKTLVQVLAGEVAGGDDEDRPGVIHRLDKDTSGLLVLARTPDAHRALAAQMRRRAIERIYVALVHGRPGARAGRIEAAVGRDRRRGRMAVDGTAARAATTHFTLTEALPSTSLLELRLETGRTHQIRVHLEAIGLPVVGDPLYGREHAPSFGLVRQFLHACRLSFVHPTSAEDLSFASELPDDLAAALERARRGDAGDVPPATV